MIEEKLNIIDEFFSHAPSSSWYNEPKNFVWERNSSHGENNTIVITDLRMVDNLQDKKVYGWLLESPLVSPSFYDFAKNNYHKFEGIFTFDKELLKLSNKFILIPLGGCWIDENDRKIYDKTKSVSMVYSDKKHLEGHYLRHRIANELSGIDLYGSGYKFIEDKIIAMKDHRFSIVVENCKTDYYFSEKLIDCFVTGTIPIYWGCPSIGKFFNIEGIITFNSIDELRDILNNIDENLYNTKKQYVIENFENSKKYIVADDLIYEKLKHGK